ncbi:MAG: phospholipase D-like domain-containing protein, partial [Betaproteobacteria bacterium]
MTAWRYALAAVITLAAVWLALNLSLGNKQIDAPIAGIYAVADEQFPRAMGTILGPPLAPGNQVETLLNGAHAFPAMLGAIRAAQRSITFETYVFWSGSIGRVFSDALSERAASGVRVHVLLDWIGGELDDAMLAYMRGAGVEIRRYNSPHWYNLHRLNHRTHRKLLVVDGVVGFTGGIGIADRWRGHAQGPGHYRDTHFSVRGPAVAQMQSAFIDNWLQATGEVLHGPAYLPDLHAAGSQRAQIFTSSPGGGAESMQLMYLLSIAAARESIRLSASYFIPDDVAVKTLVLALRRGVRIQIIVPGPHMDVPIARRASRAGWGELLTAGAEIHEYQPTMYHVKVMIVDALWVSGGSTNFDNRSFSINDEANLNVYDAAFARRQAEIFERDLAQSRRITLQEWQSRPWIEQFLDSCASLLNS